MSRVPPASWVWSVAGLLFVSSTSAGLCTADTGCWSHAQNTGQANALVFVHGSPGSAQQFRDYLDDATLATQWDVFALDRPGFGSSPAPFRVDLREQAQYLLSIAPPQPLTLVGHSLGGPVALWMAVLAPERVHAVVLLAASISPEHERVRWYNRVAAVPPLRWLLPRSWKRSNVEMFALADQLKLLLSEMSVFETPLIIVQGEKDRLVSPQSPQAFLDTVDVPHAKLRFWKDSGHLFPWREYSRTRDLLLDFIQELP